MGRTIRCNSKAAVAGIIAGLVGSVAIDAYLTGAAKISKSGARALQKAQQPAGVAAAKVVEAITGEPFPEKRVPIAGMTLHYFCGAGMGLVYGLAAEKMLGVTKGMGAAFGLVSTVVFDVLLLPAVGLDEPPWETPPIIHAQTAIGHVVFGVTTEVSRRLVRRLLG